MLSTGSGIFDDSFDCLELLGPTFMNQSGESGSGLNMPVADLSLLLRNIPPYNSQQMEATDDLQTDSFCDSSSRAGTSAN